MKRTPLVLIAVLALLVPAAALGAGSLPKPSDTTVVVPTSIAGVKLGMSEAKARAAWGGANRGECTTSKETGSRRCEYGSFEGAGGYGFIGFEAGKVQSVVVYGGKGAGGEYVSSAAAPLMKIQTASGIGIGAAYSKLKSAYPKCKKGAVTGGSSFNYECAGKKGAEFNFGVLKNKVFAIALVQP
ncbi:MAG TPA: hypothetical protein VFJ57_05695 [Solirubrobacterales bacterium]|nr:hypothetical protein [Solirubrobacterales bacterium]